MSIARVKYTKLQRPRITIARGKNEITEVAGRKKLSSNWG